MTFRSTGHDRDWHIRGRHRHHAGFHVPRVYLARPVMTDNDLKVLDKILTCGNSQHTGQDIRRGLDEFGFEIPKRSIFERVLKVFMSPISTLPIGMTTARSN